MIKIRKKSYNTLTYLNPVTGTLFTDKKKELEKTKPIWYKNQIFKFMYKNKIYYFYKNKSLFNDNYKEHFKIKENYIQFDLLTEKAPILYKLKLVTHIKFYENHAEDNFGNKLDYNKIRFLIESGNLYSYFYINEKNKHIRIVKYRELYKSNKYYYFQNKRISKKEKLMNSEEYENYIWYYKKDFKKIYKVNCKENILVKQIKIKKNLDLKDLDERIIKVQQPATFERKKNDLILYKIGYKELYTLLDLENFEEKTSILNEETVKLIKNSNCQEEIKKHFNLGMKIEELNKKMLEKKFDNLNGLLNECWSKDD